MYMDCTPEEKTEAIGMVRRMAPTLSHGGRRAALDIVEIMSGLEVAPASDLTHLGSGFGKTQLGEEGGLFVLLPLLRAGKSIGWAQVDIVAHRDDIQGMPVVSARFVMLDDEAGEDA